MKLGPVTILDKRNTTTLKKIDHDVMSAICNAIIVFPIYGQSATIQKPNSGRMVYKTYIFNKNNLLSYKN